MKKCNVYRFFIILPIVIIFVSGCASEPDSVLVVEQYKPPVSHTAEPEPDPIDEKGPGLLNYSEWLVHNPGSVSPDQVELDYLVYSVLEEDGYVTEAVFYPRVWPAGLFGGRIPEYTGTGYMYELFVTHPNMSYRADDIKFIYITIYEYEDKDVEEYINGLDGYARDEELEKDFFSKFQAGGVNIKDLKTYVRDNDVLDIIFAEDAVGRYVQINLSAMREPYVLDIADMGATRLQNHLKRAESLGNPNPEGLILDEVLDEYEDELGRYNIVYAHPTVWPREVFGDLAPVYPGEGTLHTLVVTTPMEDTSPDKALIVSLYIIEYNKADIEVYRRELLDFGYYELKPEEYNEQELGLFAEREIFHVFTVPGIKYFVGTPDDPSGLKFQITIRFEGRYMNFIAGKQKPE